MTVQAPDLEAILAQEAEAIEKYRPLVRRLPHGELFGLVKAAQEEMRIRADKARRQLDNGRVGGRIGR